MFSAATKTGGGVSLGPADDYYKYVTMLLPGNGTNGAQNNTFVDSSSNAFSITRNGNTTQGSFSPYGSLWSNYFNGSSSLEFPTPSSYYFGTNDFTVECWVNFSGLNGTGGHSFIGDWSNSTGQAVWGLFFNDQSNLLKFIYGANQTKTFSWTPSIGVWYHVAMCRSSGTLRCFINGTQIGSNTAFSTDLNNTYATNKFYLGSARNGAAFLDGYLSNIRVNNTALYTSNFTPSTTPLTAVSGTIGLMSQSNRFIDNSSSAATITVGAGTPSVQRFSPFNPTASYDTATIGGSSYMNGVDTGGSYLQTPSNSSLSQFTGDFSIEGWAYTDGVNTYNDFIQGATTGSPWWYIEISNTGSVNVSLGGGLGSLNGSGAYAKQWNHIVLCRSGSTVALFINGVRASTVTTSSTIGDTRAITIGSNYEEFGGYISGVRIVNGSSAYNAASSTLTVPTSPVSAITNTQLLLNMTNAGIPDSAMMNDLETVGNAQVSTSVKKFGTGSIKFDGTGDALYCAASSNLAFGTGDFTIEFWVYVNSFSSNRVLFDINYSNVLQIYTNTSGNLIYYTPASNKITSGSTLSTSTWYHVAVCRSGTSTKMFINGTQTGSTFTDSTDYVSGAIGIGARTSDTGLSLDGYMDDVRVTKGYARYTANFTPPTAAFPTY